MKNVEKKFLIAKLGKILSPRDITDVLSFMQFLRGDYGSSTVLEKQISMILTPSVFHQIEQSGVSI
jgi:hypothetical protein